MFTVKVYQSAGAVTVPGLEGEYVVSVVVVQMTVFVWIKERSHLDFHCTNSRTI